MGRRDGRSRGDPHGAVPPGPLLGRVFDERDGHSYVLALAGILHRLVREGNWPLWNHPLVMLKTVVPRPLRELPLGPLAEPQVEDYVVLVDTFDAGSRAAVGSRPAEIVRADVAFRGIRIGPGGPRS